jgi:hypothetical protein
MNNEYIYIVYLTINIVNDKMYIGVHKQSSREFDGYIGCGIESKNSKKLKHPKTPLQYAVKKYGYRSFRRYTVAEFDNEDDAYKLETKLVNISWIERKDTYNVTLGGKGGWSHMRLRVLQYSKDGEFIREFDSVSEAAMYTENAGRSEISASCKDKHRSSGGYYWRYKTSEDIPKKIEVGYRRNAKSKSILQYSKDGEFIAEYPSIRNAAKLTGANNTEIGKSAKNGKTKSGGYYWRYKTSEDIPKKIEIH